MESSDSFDMISGTNGLLGAADGAFVMQKEKRTDNKAVLEVAGRDQQDQKLWLNFNRERCVWELTKTETELWKEPEDPVLEKIKELVTETTPEWAGTATELGMLNQLLKGDSNSYYIDLSIYNSSSGELVSKGNTKDGITWNIGE